MDDPFSIPAPPGPAATPSMKVTLTTKGPGWPDARGWALAGALLLTFYILFMIGKNPALLAVASFMQFAGGVFTGTLALVYMNLFGGTRSGTEASAKIADAYAASPTSPPTPTAATKP